ncbi:MAG TPA: putative 2OG-Fe(II) oxygenase [Allosphingosinicella sp.]|nr:putative 2OG-Fe(II) oxygenase [Allosphingosinicella sp.]
MIDPDSAYRAGMAALETGDEAAALADLAAARAAFPGDARLWHVSALLHRAQGDLAPAIPLCATAASLAPRDFGIAHLRARVAFEAGLPAVALYEHVLGIEQRDSARLGLIEAIQQEQGPAAAAARLDRMLAGDPEWIEGHAYRAQLACTAGEPGQIAASFERALAAMPRNLLLWRELVITLIRAVRFEDALATIARARAAAGPHATFDANEGVCLDELGDHEGAERLFAPLAQVDEVDFIVRRARNALRLGRPEAAAAMLEPKLAGDAPEVAPYLSAAWRLSDEARWRWLEGDERLVGIYDLGLPEGLAERVRALHTGVAEPLHQSVRGGTQTEGHLLARIAPEIQDLRRLLAAAAARHIAQLPAADPGHPTLSRRRDRPVRFSGSWSVRLTDAGFHANHFHPEGWLSSAFYLALPEAAAGQEGWLALGEPQAELGLPLPPIRLVEPKPGRLVLFPSTMWHGTLPFAAGERLTVAFDVAAPR